MTQASSASRPTPRPRMKFGDPGFIACGQDRRGPAGGPMFIDCQRQSELWCKLDDELFCRNHGSWHVARERHEKIHHRWLRPERPA